MNTQRIETVLNIIKEAGEIALRQFGCRSACRKADRSLVTATDIEIGNFLTRRLQINFPDYGIVNEEGKEHDPDILKKHEYVWVIDPIDGTASYSSRLPVWGIAIGLLKGNEPVLGAIYLPLLDELYYTDEGMPSYFETKRWGKLKMDVTGYNDPFDNNSFLCTVSYAHKQLAIDFPGKARSLGSASAHICFVARRDSVAAIVRGAVWDVVPGWAILKNAGGACKYISTGEPPNFEEMMDGKLIKDFILLSSPAHLNMLMKMIRPIEEVTHF